MTRTFPTGAEVVRDDLSAICDTIHEELGMIAGRRLLVTGGAGFLGYYLVQTICHWNARHSPVDRIDLTVVDNFVRGTPGWLPDRQRADGFRVVKHDVTEPLPNGISDFEYIVHAASIASPIYYRKHPIEAMDANVTGLRRLLDYSVAQQKNGKPLAGFLFLSTSEIYGDPLPMFIPTSEDYRGNVSCTGPRASYDESKRFGETLCVNFAAEHGIPVRIARPFNNYGPGLKVSDGRVIPDFVRDILAGRDVALLSDGSPSRTFCYIADAIAGYFKILVRGRSGEAYNIGVETPEISMLDLAQRLAALGRLIFNYRGTVVRARSNDAAYLTDNPNRRCPVIAKARAELGFAPKVDIASGLERTMCWYRDNSVAEDA